MELLLVLACARASICATSVGEIRQAVATPVDFLKAINLASCHGLAPCVIQQLQQHAAAALPESSSLSSSAGFALISYAVWS